MASVSAVSSTDFRASLTQPQNSVTEGDDPFSSLLDSVADVKASVQRPEAPQMPERRKDVPAKQPKPEADADRQTKRQARDATKPEATSQTESNIPAKAVTAEDDTDETDSEDTVAADALPMIAVGDTPLDTTVTQAAADANAAAGGAEVQATPALAAAAADASKAATDAQAGQNGAAKPQAGIAPVSGQAKSNLELPLQGIAAETAASLSKPTKLVASLDAQFQAQTQPGSVNTENATPLRVFAPLEALQAALGKQAQLSLAIDPADVSADGAKPLLSSNAVAPNFAMTAQVNAPVQTQTQQIADASRAVPLDQLALEITTRANKGERRFDIRLDPPELGRIDVKLEIDGKGNTTTKLIVERAETLDMLQRDARGLEKALQNAGLKADAGSLQFSLQQDAQAQHGQQSHAPEMRGRPDLVQTDGEVNTQVSINNATLAAQLRGGVDVRI